MGSTGLAWWVEVEGQGLAQGDYLPDCRVPSFSPDYGPGENAHAVTAKDYDCIVLTQTCDLEQGKAPLVAMCPLYRIATFEINNPNFRTRWEEVRKGRVEGLHLIAAISDPDDNRACLVANFREIFSLPIVYLQMRASESGRRWRLQSPFLEHFSQAFARFFMRLGCRRASRLSKSRRQCGNLAKPLVRNIRARINKTSNGSWQVATPEVSPYDRAGDAHHLHAHGL